MSLKLVEFGSPRGGMRRLLQLICKPKICRHTIIYILYIYDIFIYDYMYADGPVVRTANQLHGFSKLSFLKLQELGFVAKNVS